MEDLKQITKVVKKILEDDPDCRESDNKLYSVFIQLYAFQRMINLSDMSVLEFLSVSRKLGFPPFESVRRARQKVQRKYPHLAACEAVQGFRADNETEYREYARS